MHANDYENLITAPANKSEKSESWKKRETAKRNYINRLAFARDNGCNTAMLTGCGEPQQNMHFIRLFAEMNKQLDKPFRNIEIQTTGAKITEDTIDELANCIGITTVSLSVSCLCCGGRKFRNYVALFDPYKGCVAYFTKFKSALNFVNRYCSVNDEFYDYFIIATKSSVFRVWNQY